MRMQALAAASGVPVSTIKFYLRDGLLPQGRPTARNQADYGQEHVNRLQLLRVLMKVGGLHTETVRAIVKLLDDPWTVPAEVGGRCAALAGPSVSVDDVKAAAFELGVELGPAAYKQYEKAAEIMERAEVDMCADLDETGPLLTAVLGDSLILALRHERRGRHVAGS